MKQIVFHLRRRPTGGFLLRREDEAWVKEFADDQSAMVHVVGLAVAYEKLVHVCDETGKRTMTVFV